MTSCDPVISREELELTQPLLSVFPDRTIFECVGANPNAFDQFPIPREMVEREIERAEG